jgi:exonuclease VII small subunit
MPPDPPAFADFARRLTTLETRLKTAETRIQTLEHRLATDLEEANRQLSRGNDLAERHLAAANQLGQILASAEIVQAARSQPTTPWKHT